MVPLSDRGDRAPVGSSGTQARVNNISDAEFDAIRGWIYERAGISLSAQKKALVVGRLAPRLRHHQVRSHADYFQLLKGDRAQAEAQIAIDLLTTNETHFFREPKHFDFLRKIVLPQHPARRQFRVWSAASSSGEEAFSIAMTLATELGDAPWEVFATDLSSRVLERAALGHYSMARTDGIPRDYLRAHCLKGVGPQEGTLLIAPHIRNRVQFSQVNLNNPLPAIGEFDLIFLRNVMIYFDVATKRQVVARVLACLRPGGYLLIGHSESLNGVVDSIKAFAPSIYQKPL
jgi:chemotaxis protein methyltransferase CheR